MAETKVTELPVMTDIDFTANDRFLVIDDGELKQLTRGILHNWILDNVQGEQGIQGVAGRDGVNGAKGADGNNGKDGLSAYQIAVSNGFIGTQVQWEASLKGATGAKGADGGLGWTPAIKTVARGSETVLQLYDWVGGTGTKPTLLGYIGDTGVVSNIANASNIKGLKGDTGERGLQGIQGVAGTNGLDGIGSKNISSVEYTNNLETKIVFTDATSITSTPPPKNTGWATYKDTAYTSSSPFLVPTTTQVVIPNNGLDKIEQLPTIVSSFYNPTNQKYLLTDPTGFYIVRVMFKAIADAQDGFINLSMSKDTTEIPYSEDRSLRGDSTIQDFSFSTELYGDSALSTNGLTIRIKTYSRAISIYNIEVIISKVI